MANPTTLAALWQRQDAHYADRPRRWGLTAAEETLEDHSEDGAQDIDNDAEDITA